MGSMRWACAPGLVIAGGCAVFGGGDGAQTPLRETDPSVPTVTIAGEAASLSEGTEGGRGRTDGRRASACVDVKSTGLDAKSCDNMNITPFSAGGPAMSICDASGGTAGRDPPPGYAACQRGFEIFNQGPAENLQRCLGAIGVEPPIACDPRRVQRCMNEMYDSTCAGAQVTKYCNDNARECKSTGQTFDAVKCAYELKPFNAKTISAYEACFNNADPNLTCQQAHDNCYIDQL